MTRRIPRRPATLSPTDAEAAPRRVTLVAYPDIQVLDLTGPIAVFYNALRAMERQRRDAGPAYVIETVSPDGGRIGTQQGVAVLADRRLVDVLDPPDTLIVTGGSGVHSASRDRRIVDWLAAMAPRARRICSVCTGAFLLAEAGLLDGRRATTHWASCELLAKRYPSVTVEPDSIYVRDGNVWTSAGVTAGMDLALALVEDDFGRECAITAARWLVMFARRPGGQSQFSAHLAAQAAEHEPIAKAQAWIVDHLDADLSVAALAERVAMSPRNFARVFVRETGSTPADFVEAARIDAARRALEQSRGGVEQVARACGFSDAEHMRRAFHRRLGVSPQDYRARFRTQASHVTHIAAASQ
ncbi:MAG TPA: GlxA family transcriptional regulator [Candidatus Cybelea sp.]|nr:GlxA family transcriptional regulator [Candidatus Cybelea sp.]